MPTTILDGETYEQALHRRFTEEAKVIEKMQQDEIIRMAKESGAVERYFGNQLHGIAFHKKEWLERFAALVAAHEREAIMEIVNTIGGDFAVECAAAIRARNVDSVDTSPKRVEKTAKSIHDESTNPCQKSTELAEKDCGGAHHHRYAGSFGGLI